MEQGPSWEANWFAAGQEIPRILGNPNVPHRTHKRPPPVSNCNFMTVTAVTAIKFMMGTLGDENSEIAKELQTAKNLRIAHRCTYKFSARSSEFAKRKFNKRKHIGLGLSTNSTMWTWRLQKTDHVFQNVRQAARLTDQTVTARSQFLYFCNRN